MKKCLLILAAFLLTPSTGSAETVFNDAATFVVAKAVKLGRGKSAFSSQNGALGANQGATKIDDGSCKASSDCEKGQNVPINNASPALMAKMRYLSDELCR